MVDVPTTVWGFIKQTIGGNRNTWGGILNANFDLVEAALAGKLAKAVTGGAVTLTEAERLNRILSYSGTLASNAVITVENDPNGWIVNNLTTGAFTLSMKTSGGAAVVIPQGGWALVWCDGADGIYVGYSSVQVQAPDGTLALPGLSWKNETDSGWRRVSAAVFGFIIGGIQRIRVEAELFKITLGSAVDVFSSTDEQATMGVPLEVPELTINGEAPFPIGGEAPCARIRAPNGWLFEFGQAVSRTTYAALLAALTEAVTATRSDGSPILTSVSVDLREFGLVGAKIEGTGISSGTTITAVSSTTITMSQNASGNGSITATIFPHGNGDGSTTFNVPDGRGYVYAGRDSMGGTSANRLTKAQTQGVDGDNLANVGGEEGHTPTEAEMFQHNHGVTDPGHTHTNKAFTAALGGGADVTAVQGGGNTSVSTVNSNTTGITVNNAGSSEAHNNVQPTAIRNWIIFTGVYS